jgi:hypothetical protein
MNGGTGNPNGGARYKFDRNAIVAAIVEGCSAGAEDCILQVQREIRANLSKPGSGVWHAGNPARSSAPGQPPATQTGRLQSAWQAKPQRWGIGRTIGWALGVGRVPYARILEYGGKTGRNNATKIEARPYVRPAVATVQAKAVRIFAGYIERSLRRAMATAGGP